MAAARLSLLRIVYGANAFEINDIQEARRLQCNNVPLHGNFAAVSIRERHPGSPRRDRLRLGYPPRSISWIRPLVN
jgi:hypothetical protein